ncbi:MAG: DUF2203 domain-containing protein [Acidimicrobiales bacterium]
MDEPSRAWTVAEANGVLPWVGEVVERAQDLWADYQAHTTTRLRLVRQNGHGVVPADPSPIKACVEELTAEGIVLRDIERGLIDFPAQARDGRWYWLCWLQGEDEVAWWHWPDDGFAGRTSIAQLP